MTTHPQGTLIGQRYRVVKVLSGGMGIVYVCVDESQHGHPIALKTFQDRFLSSAVSRDRFLREATVWVELGYHPNIVQAISAFRLEDQSVYIVLQLIPPLPGARDPSLRSLLHPGAPLPPDKCLQHGLQVARGMAYASSRIPGLIHRDLKPENILIAPDGSARITDFGLATILDTTIAEDHHQVKAPPFNRAQITQGALGTPLYMSPEQWSGRAADARSDIYALGLTLLEALTGNHPIHPSSLEHIAQSHIKGIPSATLRASSLNVALKTLLQGFLTPDPASRYRDWSTVEAAISRTFTELLHVLPPREEFPIDVSVQGLLLRGESYLAVGSAYVDIGQCSVAAEYFTRTLDIARTQQHLPLAACALANLAISAVGLGRAQSALPLYTEAIDLFLGLGLTNHAANNLANLGNAYLMLADYPNAAEYLSKALAMFQDARNTPSVARCNSNLANVHIALGEFHTANQILHQALQVAEANGDIQSEAKCLAGIGLAHESLGDLESALRSYTTALSKARQVADRQTEAVALVAAGSCVGKAGDLGQGIRLLEEGLALSKELGDSLAEARASGNLGMLHIQAGRPSIARSLLEHSLRLATDIHADDVRARAHWALGILQEATGRYHEAVEHEREAVILYKKLRIPFYDQASAHLLALRKRLGLA